MIRVISNRFAGPDARRRWRRLTHCLMAGVLMLPTSLLQARDMRAKPPAGPIYTVGFAQDHMANDWRAAQVRDVKTVLDRHPDIRFVYTDAMGNTARQILHIEELAGFVDVLITSPRDADAMRPVLEQVHARGIPIVLLSRRVDGHAYDTLITADNRDIARRAAYRLAQRLGGKGRILMLQHIPTTTPGRDRTEGFFEGLLELPGLEVVAIERADSLRGQAIQAVERVLARGIEFDAIYAQSDSMASGARLALKQAGIDVRAIPTVGIDYIAEAREAIRNAEQDASFTYPTFGREGAEAAVNILRGRPVRREIIVDSVMVTKENLDQVAPIF